jgi:predicted MFS family arabinose efflux permease
MSIHAGTLGEPLRLLSFRTFWVASTLGFFGLSITTLAVDVLVIQGLHASEVEVGVVRAAQFVPYLLIGLIAGALVDRWRRRPTLVITNLAQGLLLLLVPMLWWFDALTVWVVAGVLLTAGSFAVFAAAAEQSLLPDLVPRHSLVSANARLGQSMTVAQSAGPPLAGALMAWLNIASALVLGGLTRMATAMLVSRIPDEEPAPDVRPRLTLRSDIVSGLKFIYGHRTLAPLALSTHIWFLANSIAMTILGLFVLRELGLTAAGYGLVLAAAGVGGFTGALCAPRVGRRLREGNAIILGRLLCSTAWLAMTLTPELGATSTLLFVCSAQLLYGFAMGLEDPNEMGYWQAVTPREMLGRVNATRRSANRSTAVVGALLGGLVAAVLGFRGTLIVVTAVFLIASLVAALSPLRGARA